MLANFPLLEIPEENPVFYHSMLLKTESLTR